MVILNLIAYFCFIVIKIIVLMVTDNISTTYVDEDLNGGPQGGVFIAIRVVNPEDDMVVARKRPCLFDLSSMDLGGLLPRIPEIKIKHNNDWEQWGRAYYQSFEYELKEFHYTICSIDELRQRLEEWDRYHEKHDTGHMPLIIPVNRTSEYLDRYFAECNWNDCLCDCVEEFKIEWLFERQFLEENSHSHFPFPFVDVLLYQEQLVKFNMSGLRKQASAILRPCCRSFLAAPRCDDADDDPMSL